MRVPSRMVLDAMDKPLFRLAGKGLALLYRTVALAAMGYIAQTTLGTDKEVTRHGVTIEHLDAAVSRFFPMLSALEHRVTVVETKLDDSTGATRFHRGNP